VNNAGISTVAIAAFSYFRLRKRKVLECLSAVEMRNNKIIIIIMCSHKTRRCTVAVEVMEIS